MNLNKPEWATEFVNYLKFKVKHELQSKNFESLYNKGGNSRTQLILGRGSDRKSGMVYQVLKDTYEGHDFNLNWNATNNKKQEIGFENYKFDCVVYTELGGDWNDWHKGKLHIDIVVEVENNFLEFMGTLSDLMRIQSHRKVGIFYHNNVEDKNSMLKKCENGIRTVFTYFKDADFLEAENTQYLIVLLPERCGVSFISSILAFRFHTIIAEKTLDIERTLSTLQEIAE